MEGLAAGSPHHRPCPVDDRRSRREPPGRSSEGSPLAPFWLVEASSSKLSGSGISSWTAPACRAGLSMAGLSRPGAAWSPQGRAQRLTGGGPVASVRLGRLIRRRIPQGGGAVYT